MAPLAFACALVPRDRAVAVSPLPTLSPLSDLGSTPARGVDADTSTSIAHLMGDSKDYERRIAAEGRSSGGPADSPPALQIRSSHFSVRSPTPTTDTLAEGRTSSGLLGQADGRRRSSGGSSAEAEAGLLSSSVEFLPVEEEEKQERAIAIIGGSVEGADTDTEVPMDWERHAPDTYSEGEGEGEGRRNMDNNNASIISLAREGWGAGGQASAGSSFGSLNSSGDSPFPGLSESGQNTSGVVDRSVVKDVIEVASRPVFCLVVLGSAATAAVTAGMSTFGTGFVTSLEFLTSERAAAAAFGAVICAAGLAGTPAGGAMIDAADPDGRLDDEKKLAMILTQATTLMCGSTGECGVPEACCRVGRVECRMQEEGGRGMRLGASCCHNMMI